MPTDLDWKAPFSAWLRLSRAKIECGPRLDAVQAGFQAGFAAGRLAALREGHLEGDAVAGAEDEWRPGMLAMNARHDVPGVFPALGRAACVQAVEHHHGAVYLQLGPGNSHTYLADLFDRALPVKMGGRHGE